MKTIGIVSLGCAKNLVDSEAILGMFPEDRFAVSQDPSKADVIIINTCGFIESAKRESIETILEMASYKAKIVAVGCFVERNLKELKEEIPEVDLWVPLKDYPRLHILIEELLGEKGLSPYDLSKRVISTSPWSSYLKISEGCDNMCAFCAIPYIRGRMVSRPLDEIMSEAKSLHEKGVKEISLVSQDPMHYGLDFPKKKPGMLELLKELDQVGFESIRLLYLYPEEITDEELLFIKNSRSIEPYFDIPIQSASDKVLKLMNRHGTVEEMRLLFKKIDSMFPKKALRTTLITGFPGETKSDHIKTMKFVKEIGFDHLGVFAYSREEGTAAYNRPNQVSFETKEKRRAEIMSLAKTISYEKNKARIGETMEGFVVAYDPKQKLYSLRSYWNAPDDIDGKIYFKSERPLKNGERVKVKIERAFVYDLMGVAIE